MEDNAPIERPVDAELRLHSSADLPASVDNLGFTPYVSALERFLTNEETHGPLTISIEGEWGSGKSSFMMQLAAKLEQSANHPIIIRFNAWRYDRADELWASFALEFMRQIRKQQLTRSARWNAYWKLFRLRFKWGSGWRDVGRAFTWFVIVSASIFAGIYYGKDVVTKWFLGIATTAVGLGSAASWLAQRIGNPLEIDLKQHSKSPDYTQKISFLEQFHEDFVNILNH